METQRRPDKFVRHKLAGDFALHFGETIRYNQKGIEIVNKFPGDVGTLIITNFRVYWFSQVNLTRNVSIGFQRVIAVGKRKINIDEPSETYVLCILTYDSPWHREYIFKNRINLQDLKHITVFMDIFRAFTSTKPYRDVLSNSEIIHNKQLKTLPYEQVYTRVEGVAKLSENRDFGTFILTNIRSVWFAEDNELYNVSLPHLCVEKVSVAPTEYGNATVLEIEDQNQLFGLKFHAEPLEKHDFLVAHLYNQLVQFNDFPLVGF